MGDGHPCYCSDDSNNDSGLEFQDGSNKASFLDNYQPHVLYFWQLMEDNGLLDNCNVCLKSAGVLSEYSDISSATAVTCKCQAHFQKERERQEEENKIRKFVNM